MIPDHMEPVGLDRDASPLADFMAMASMRTDAELGSEKLRRAILRAAVPKKRVAPKRVSRRYGSWTDRQLVASQIARMQETVASFYGISPSELTQPGRGPQSLAHKRQVAMYLARQVLQSSFPDIAREFGRKDHTTILHACEVVESTPELKADADLLRQRIR